MKTSVSLLFLLIFLLLFCVGVTLIALHQQFKFYISIFSIFWCVFNPCTRSNRQATLQSTYRRHEQEKKRQYDQRCAEHSTFTPLLEEWPEQPQPSAGGLEEWPEQPQPSAGGLEEWPEQPQPSAGGLRQC